MLQNGDVSQRIAVDGDEVSELTFLDGAYGILPRYKIRRRGGSGANRLDRWEAELHQRGQFQCVFTLLVVSGGIETAGNSDMRRACVGDVRPQRLHGGPHHSALRWRSGFVNARDRGGGGDEKDTLGCHKRKSLFVDFRAMFDGVDSGFDRIARAFAGGRVGGDAMPTLMRLLDNSSHFIPGQRLVEMRFGIRGADIKKIRVDLDQVGAVVHLLADGPASLVSPSDELRAPRKIM